MSTPASVTHKYRWKEWGSKPSKPPNVETATLKSAGFQGTTGMVGMFPPGFTSGGQFDLLESPPPAVVRVKYQDTRQ